MRTTRLGVRLLMMTVVCGCLAACQPKKPPAESPPAASAVPESTTSTTVAISSLDSLYSELAQRVSDKVNGVGVHEDDFVVTPIPLAQWDVGTVLQAERSVPVTFGACRPAANDAEVNTQDIPNLFPTYTMKRDIGFDAGLDEAVFRGLAAANANASLSNSIDFEIAEAATRLWSDIGIAQVLASTACRKVLNPGSKYRLVRGLVMGKRQFSFGVQNTGGGQIQLPNVAHVKFQIGGDGSQIKVADEESLGFLAIVTQFQVPADNSPTVAIARPAAPQTDPANAKTYVQRDSADNPNTAKQVVASLQAAGFDVASVVERVPSARMPSVPQVRYFRAEDRERAEKLLAVLKSRYPDAKLVALRFPAPPGQLEVWLQKIGP